MTEIGEVAIAGAGIGGLALAAALRRQPALEECAIRVFERTPRLTAAGAGITVQCNAMLALRRVGLDAAVAAEGAEITRGRICAANGRVLVETDLRAFTRELGAAGIALHRARLHRVLMDAAGPERVETGRAVTAYEDLGDRVRVRLEDGGTAEADLLVGADGLRSAVREQMVGDSAPIYAGYTSWRGVTLLTDSTPRGLTIESWGRGARFGIVPIGHGEVYWFAVAGAPAGGHDRDVRAELLERFAGWHAPVPELIASTPADRILRTDIADRPPLDRWTAGRVVLLGDAAHPMTPNLGQGGCQAIEDAVVLAAALAGASDLEAALREYERRRVSRANRIVAASRRMGAAAQWSHPLACWARNTGLRLTPPAALRRQVRGLWTFS